MELEHCCDCDEPTGNAGRGDGSIYIEYHDKEVGPLCDECGDKRLLSDFGKHGRQASCHYADDSGKEWPSGDVERRKALGLFDDNPGMQGEMREIAKGFLWEIRLDRPEKENKHG